MWNKRIVDNPNGVGCSLCLCHDDEVVLRRVDIFDECHMEKFIDKLNEIDAASFKAGLQRGVEVATKELS